MKHKLKQIQLSYWDILYYKTTESHLTGKLVDILISKNTIYCEKKTIPGIGCIKIK